MQILETQRYQIPFSTKIEKRGKTAKGSYYEKTKYSASISSMQNIDDIDDGNAGFSAGIWNYDCCL